MTRQSAEQDTPQEFWSLILDDPKLQMARATFAAWLQTARAIGQENGTLFVRVPNARAKNWLQNRRAGTIQRTVDYFSSSPLEIRFVANGSQPDALPINRRGAKHAWQRSDGP
jgi:chromosomal replication initiation ATPase DnaA